LPAAARPVREHAAPPEGAVRLRLSADHARPLARRLRAGAVQGRGSAARAEGERGAAAGARRVIETVRGPAEPAALGRTLGHDHVFILGQETLANYNHRWGEAWWDEEDGVAHAVEKLQRAKAGGIDTLIDPTAVGLGRDVGRIKRINDQ